MAPEEESSTFIVNVPDRTFVSRKSNANQMFDHSLFGSGRAHAVLYVRAMPMPPYEPGLTLLPITKAALVPSEQFVSTPLAHRSNVPPEYVNASHGLM